MMFQGDQQERVKGKRTSGFQTQKDGGFNLGWDVPNQMNDFQKKRQSKGQNMANKVNGYECENQKSSTPQQTLSYDDQCRKFIMANPDITTDQLQQKMALWEANLNTPRSAYSNTRDLKYEAKKPNESAKNIIYGGQNQRSTGSNVKQTNSRRNQGTFSLGDGYNYFKDQNK